jgi:DNA-binding response OmpR family regulator
MSAFLLAEDADEAAILTVVLQRAGLDVNRPTGFEKALQTWLEHPADLIMLTQTSAKLEAQVRRIRAVAQVPLILILDPISETLSVTLFELGADLIITRPFSSRLLLAQIRALRRRAGSVPLFSLPTLSRLGLVLDPATRTVEVEGNTPRRLTHLEFRLLYTLMMHDGQVLPAEAIVERVWGYNGKGDRDLVGGLISRLRAKIEDDPRSPYYILTVPAVGYLFRDNT